MIDLKDIGPLTDFQRATKEHIRRLKATGRPRVLTVNGKPELVVLDAASFQRMMETVEHAETIVAIQAGLDDAAAGRTKPLKDAFAVTRRRLGMK